MIQIETALGEKAALGEKEAAKDESGTSSFSNPVHVSVHICCRRNRMTYLLMYLSQIHPLCDFDCD